MTKRYPLFFKDITWDRVVLVLRNVNCRSATIWQMIGGYSRAVIGFLLFFVNPLLSYAAGIVPLPAQRIVTNRFSAAVKEVRKAAEAKTKVYTISAESILREPQKTKKT